MNYDWTGVKTKRLRVAKAALLAASLLAIYLIPWIALSYSR